MGGNGLSAQHQAVADQPRDDSASTGRRKGILNEVVVKHRPEVLLGAAHPQAQINTAGRMRADSLTESSKIRWEFHLPKYDPALSRLTKAMSVYATIIAPLVLRVRAASATND